LQPDPQPDTTEELIRLGEPLPTETRAKATTADREKLVQRYGRTCTAVGLSLTAGPLAAVAVVASCNPDLRTWPDGLLILSGALVLAAMITGAVFLAAGLAEQMARYGRSQGRRALAEQAWAAREREEDRRHLEEALHVMGRALDAIAEHLPEHDRIVNWRGFNDAVREGFVESTGTDGALRRRPGGPLGVVPNHWSR
jgi:hypothetical protein